MTKLRELMNEANVTIYDVGKALNIAPSTVYQMADGNMPVNKHVVKLAKYFSVTTDLLFGNSPSCYIVKVVIDNATLERKVPEDFYHTAIKSGDIHLYKSDHGIERVNYLDETESTIEKQKCEEVLNKLSAQELRRALAVLEAMFK